MADQRGELLIGSHIARYVVLKLLGEGGMGAVYLVEHADLKPRHAIKVLAPHRSRHPQIAQRFRNAARAAAIARSPDIIAVRDFGELEDGCWDPVMDYREGATLSGFLASRGPLSHELIIRIAAAALGGLAAAHRENILHRDVKPDNVYLAQADGDLRAMILDPDPAKRPSSASDVAGQDLGTIRRAAAPAAGRPAPDRVDQRSAPRGDHADRDHHHLRAAVTDETW